MGKRQTKQDHIYDKDEILCECFDKEDDFPALKPGEVACDASECRSEWLSEIFEDDDCIWECEDDHDDSSPSHEPSTTSSKSSTTQTGRTAIEWKNKVVFFDESNSVEVNLAKTKCAIFLKLPDVNRHNKFKNDFEEVSVE